MNERIRRFIWLFMAILFIVSALGVGVYAFWTNTHKTGSTGYIGCVAPKSDQKFSQNYSSGGKLANTKLVGYAPAKVPGYVSCIDFKQGSGATATVTSTVTVIYTGALATSGVIFQSSLDTGQPATLPLNQVIPGWSAAIPGMKVGGQRRLLIPAQYGYGAQAQAGIPANSDLVFDVTLLAAQ